MSDTIEIRLAESDDDIRRCHPVMRQLRENYGEAEFVERVKFQQTCGYQLAFLTADGQVRAVAGFRILENLSWRRYLHVDDLVSDADARSRGHGAALLGWLKTRARELGCNELHLDSGVQRFGAHRFYLAQRMDITCHHFGTKIDPA